MESLCWFPSISLHGILGMFPDKRVILTAYEADFAATWGRRARDVLNEYGKMFLELK